MGGPGSKVCLLPCTSPAEKPAAPTGTRLRLNRIGPAPPTRVSGAGLQPKAPFPLTSFPPPSTQSQKLNSQREEGSSGLRTQPLGYLDDSALSLGSGTPTPMNGASPVLVAVSSRESQPHPHSPNCTTGTDLGVSSPVCLTRILPSRGRMTTLRRRIQEVTHLSALQFRRLSWVRFDFFFFFFFNFPASPPSGYIPPVPPPPRRMHHPTRSCSVTTTHRGFQRSGRRRCSEMRSLR